MKKVIIILIALHSSLLTLHSQIINVPADYPTIQEGIDAAGIWGDTVLVAPGTYYENIFFKGKRIMVTSNYIFSGDTMDIINTIIDGSQPANPDFGSVVMFDFFEDTTSIICGFTITGGTGMKIPAFDVTGGGGIAISNSGAKIINNNIENNSVSDAHAEGGGIGFGPRNDPNLIVIRNNKIRNNEATGTLSASGGGITCGNAIICNNSIVNNTVQITESGSIYKCSGGGIFASGSDNPEPFYIKLTGNVISGNKSLSGSNDEWNGYGGGISLYNVMGIMKNNTITENEISTFNKCLGGGIVCMYSDTSLLIEGNIISHNYFSNGQSLGGGLMFYNASARLVNNMIYKNLSTKGGGLYIWDEDGGNGIAQIINNTIAENEADDDGGAIYNDNTVSYVFNTIIWDNESNGGDDLSGDYEIRYSDIEGDFTGEGNIDEDPEFIDPDNDDFHIPEDSPCAIKGMEVVRINDTWLYCPVTDFEGDPRPWEAGTLPDMGADEVFNPIVGIRNPEQSELNVSVYPNPCSNATRLRYLIHDPSASLGTGSGYLISDLYMISGKKIRELVRQEATPSEFELEIDVSDLPAGVYLIKIQTGDVIALKKLIVQ